MTGSENQVVSRARVVDHGEVYTSEKEVKNMLDLVIQETERIDSKFLEPACGTGNFLIEILNRKLKIIIKKYKKNQTEFEKYCIMAVSSIYGIDILEDNTIQCRKRLSNLVKTTYLELYNDKFKKDCLDSVSFILDKNIIWGNALTLETVNGLSKPIIFSEWSFIQNNLVKRRDFTFSHLLDCSSSESGNRIVMLNKYAFIPKPYESYPSRHYLRLKDAEN